MNLIDTSAWVDYFSGVSKARQVGGIVERRQAAASVITLAEIKLKGTKLGRDWSRSLDFIEQYAASITDVTKEIALRAGEFKTLHTTDAIIYATAIELGMTLITSDKDFKGLRGVTVLE